MKAFDLLKMLDADNRVLVVDDDEGIRNGLSALLDFEGFEVLSASNGIEALRMLEYRPSLIILDLSMPLMDGYEFYDRLQQMKEAKHISVIVLTAKKDPKQIPGVKFMSKPFKMDDVIKVVSDNCTRKME